MNQTQEKPLQMPSIVSARELPGSKDNILIFECKVDINGEKRPAIFKCIMPIEESDALYIDTELEALATLQNLEKLSVPELLYPEAVELKINGTTYYGVLMSKIEGYEVPGVRIQKTENLIKLYENVAIGLDEMMNKGRYNIDFGDKSLFIEFNNISAVTHFDFDTVYFRGQNGELIIPAYLIYSAGTYGVSHPLISLLSANEKTVDFAHKAVMWSYLSALLYRIFGIWPYTLNGEPHERLTKNEYAKFLQKLHQSGPEITISDVLPNLEPLDESFGIIYAFFKEKMELLLLEDELPEDSSCKQLIDEVRELLEVQKIGKISGHSATYKNSIEIPIDNESDDTK